ncbi:MAG: YHS domain-containing protein [Actinobacteria bacterium]|nr:YHS domain-containing protein [Actinomycetota bacterium]
MTEASTREHTFAFVDLAGFTALTEAHGDEDAVALLTRFEKLVATSLGDDDILVKTIGDAVMVAAPSPDSGLSFTVRLFEASHGEPDFPVLRAGLHHGPAVERNGDWFGASVNLAARVAAQAHAGQTLVTDTVVPAAHDAGIEVVDLGEFDLRNIAEPVHLWEVLASPAHDQAGVDPVCRMRVWREESAGRLRHQNADYWFCSLDCAAQFAADPARFS